MHAENTIWYKDYIRVTDDEKFLLKHYLRDYIFQHRLRYMICFRKAKNSKNKIKKLYYEWRLYRLGRKYGIELKTQTEVGEGFVMTHPYNITVSPFAKIGKNVTMLKGATIGLTAGGEKPGAPIIGDSVYVGLNSTVLGGVTIGNDVLIAPNTLVNCDVPAHSVVIGNPCTIHHKENATAAYIWKKV